MGIFSFGKKAAPLAGLRSSAELAEAEQSAAERIEAVDRDIRAREEARGEAIAAGDDARVLALRHEIRDLREEREELATLKGLVAARKAEALAREHRAEVEAKLAPLEDIVRDYIKEIGRWPAAVAAFNDLEARLRDQGERIRQLNTFANREGRPDLMVELPLSEWMDRVRLEATDEANIKREAAGLNPIKPEHMGGGYALDMPWIVRPRLSVPDWMRVIFGLPAKA